jgi:hypothetical protein
MGRARTTSIQKDDRVPINSDVYDHGYRKFHHLRWWRVAFRCGCGGPGVQHETPNTSETE